MPIMQITKEQPQPDTLQNAKFRGSATISVRLQNAFENLDSNAQRQILMMGSIPKMMALALSTKDHRTKSLFAIRN